MTPIQQYLSSFGHSRPKVPKDLKSAIRKLPEVGTIPSPWGTWTLIDLLQHRERQIWAREIISKTRPDLLERGGWETKEGCIPGLQEWDVAEVDSEFCFITITHRETREALTLTLDSEDRVPEYFFTFDLLASWESLHMRPGRARLLQLHPTPGTIQVAIDELRTFDLVQEIDLDRSAGHVGYRLTAAALEHAAAIDEFVVAWEDEDAFRFWMATVVGDWVYAAPAALPSWDSELVEMTKALADRCRAHRLMEANEYLSEGDCTTRRAALFDLGEDLPPGIRGPWPQPERRPENAVTTGTATQLA
jgi:hypothetical protein